IHTSNLISESAVGLITPATRQKAGKSLYGAAGPVAGVNAPGATDCAAVMVVLGSLRSASFSHVWPLADGKAARKAAHNNPKTSFADERLANAKRLTIIGPPFQS